MRAEQTTSCTYSVSELYPTLHVQMTIGLEAPGEPGVDVSVGLSFEPVGPERLSDVVRDALFDGVHSGIAVAGLPIPRGGISIDVASLQIQPTPNPGITDEDIRRLAETLGALVMGAVGALWAGLAALSETP